MSAEVIVVDYDPEWPSRAARLMGFVDAALSPAVRRIEHIGSTAIAGMAAKDVIDLQASVDDLDAVEVPFDAPLAALGFRRGIPIRDHVPAGRPDRPETWAKRMWVRREHPDGDVNLHVRKVGSPNERLALLFRDWLRAHPEAGAAYAAFKQSLAGIVPDVGTYSDVKDPVVDLVIAVAEPWAARVGWVPTPV